MKKLIVFLFMAISVISANAQIFGSKVKSNQKEKSEMITYDTENLMYKSGKHIQSATYCEIGGIGFCALGVACVAACDDNTTKTCLGAACGVGALACYIAKLCHMNKSGHYLKLVSANNSIGVQYTIGNKKKKKNT